MWGGLRLVQLYRVGLYYWGGVRREGGGGGGGLRWVGFGLAQASHVAVVEQQPQLQIRIVSVHFVEQQQSREQLSFFLHLPACVPKVSDLLYHCTARKLMSNSDPNAFAPGTGRAVPKGCFFKRVFV